MVEMPNNQCNILPLFQQIYLRKYLKYHRLLHHIHHHHLDVRNPPPLMKLQLNKKYEDGEDDRMSLVFSLKAENYTKKTLFHRYLSSYFQFSE